MQANPNGQSQNRINTIELNIIPRPAPEANANNQPIPAPNSFNLHFLGMSVTQSNLKFIEQNKVLLISGKTQMINPENQSYYEMIKINFFPHIVWYSLPFLLIYTCTIVFIVQVSLGFKNNSFLEVNQDTYTKMGVNLSQAVYRGQLYRLIVSIFLHVNLIHLVSNMLSLLLILAVIQYTFGWKKTLLVFLVSGIMGNIFSNLISTDITTTMIKMGASNSLYGMIGLSIGYIIINWSTLQIIGPIFKLKIILYIILTAILMIIFTDQANKADYSGHLGGFLAGLFISGMMPSLKFQERQQVLRIILSVLFLGMVLSCFLVFYLAPQSSYSS